MSPIYFQSVSEFKRHTRSVCQYSYLLFPFLFQQYHPTILASADCLIAGGSDYGQWPYFTETGDIILEIDDHQVAGYTSGDIEEMMRGSPAHSFRVVASNLGLPLELREYLNRRFARGSLDHKLQEVIRENVYARTIPCTTRPPRAGEEDEVDYKFLSVEAFAQMERAGLLLESGLYQGYHYGKIFTTFFAKCQHLIFHKS